MPCIHAHSKVNDSRRACATGIKGVAIYSALP